MSAPNPAPESLGPLATMLGLTLRDYFAGQAIVALFPNRLPIERVVESAYDIADAMLKERAE